MSVLNELNDSGNLNNLLQRRFNLVGSAPAPALMPEIPAQIVLEGERPEYGHLKREVRWSAAGSLGGVAGRHSTLWLRPFGGRLIVLTSIQLMMPVANARCRVFSAAAEPAFELPIGIQSVNCTDLRGNTFAPVSLFAGHTLLATTEVRVFSESFSTAANVPVTTPKNGIILANSRRNVGEGIVIQTNPAQEIWYTIEGTAREAFPGELD